MANTIHFRVQVKSKNRAATKAIADAFRASISEDKDEGSFILDSQALMGALGLPNQDGVRARALLALHLSQDSETFGASMSCRGTTPYSLFETISAAYPQVEFTIHYADLLAPESWDLDLIGGAIVAQECTKQTWRLD